MFQSQDQEPSPFQQTDPRGMAPFLHDLGFNVIAMRPGARTPAAGTWKERKNNRLDEHATRQEFMRYDQAKVGVIADEQSRMVFIDPDGDDKAAVAEILASYGLPPTMTVMARRGEHIFLRWPDNVPYPERSVYLEPKGSGREIELKVGTPTAMPGQTHPADGTPYVWGPNNVFRVAEAPQTIVDRYNEVETAFVNANPEVTAGWAQTLFMLVDGGHLDDLIHWTDSAWSQTGTRHLRCPRAFEHRGAENGSSSAYLITEQGAGMRCDKPAHSFSVLEFLEEIHFEATPNKIKTKLRELRIPFPADFNPDNKPSLRVDSGNSAMIARSIMQMVGDANKAKPRLFKRSGKIVRIEHSEHGAEFKPVSSAAMRVEIAEEVALYTETNGNRKAVRTPRDVAEDCTTMAPEVIPLIVAKSITHVPTYAPDGSLHDEPGYNSKTGNYFAPPGSYVRPEIPANPTKEDVAAAVTLYCELLQDFPFRSPADFANMMALVLTPPTRTMYDGPLPMFNIEANTPGTGKSKAAHVALRIGLPGNHNIHSGTWVRKEEEREKRLLGVFVAGSPTYLFDNVSSHMASDSLEMVLTSAWYSGRTLGATGMVDCAVRTMFVMTSNNATMNSSLARRIVPISLDAKCADPSMRTGFTHDPLEVWANANSARLNTARLILVQAWIAAGRPGAPAGTPVFGSYEEWRDIIGGILSVANIQGFLQNVDDFRNAAATDYQSEKSFFSAWYERCKLDDGTRTASVKSSSIVDLAINTAFLSEHSIKTVESATISLGKVLGNLTSRGGIIRNGLRVVRGKDTRNNAKTFYLERVPGTLYVAPEIDESVADDDPPEDTDRNGDF